MTDEQCEALVIAIRNLTQVHSDAMADLISIVEQGFGVIASNLTGDPDAVPLAIGQASERIVKVLENQLTYVYTAIARGD